MRALRAAPFLRLRGSHAAQHERGGAGFARAYDAEGVFAILLVVICVAVVADSLVGMLDKRVSSWLPRNHR